MTFQNLPNICDEKTILANTQMVIEKDIIESKDFIHPYCLNLDTLGNCLSYLVSVGALRKTRRYNYLSILRENKIYNLQRE